MCFDCTMLDFLVYSALNKLSQRMQAKDSKIMISPPDCDARIAIVLISIAPDYD